MKDHSASERSVGYLFLMRATVANYYPTHPFRTVSLGTRVNKVAAPAWVGLVVVHDDGVPSGSLGPVERLVRLAKQPLGVVPRPPLDNPCAEGQWRFFAARQHRRVLAQLHGGALQHPLSR